MALKMLKSTLPRLDSSLKPAPTASDQRITGRRLQARRHRIWRASPYCAMCGRLTDWPYGFELDHVVALANGGADTDANCQVLCIVWMDGGVKAGCHIDKTAQDLGANRRGRLGRSAPR